jgi:hypothetical protein
MKGFAPDYVPTKVYHQTIQEKTLKEAEIREKKKRKEETKV